MPDNKSRIRIGTVLDGRYKVVRILSVSDMSHVWLAEDEETQSQYIVKEAISSSNIERQGIAERALRNEWNIMRRLKHDAIPRPVAMIQHASSICIIMDYIEGETLQERLHRRAQAFDQQQVIAWGVKLCEILDYLHHESIIYRDLKPSNIIVREDNSLALIDFGISFDQKVNNAKRPLGMGTPGFASPEQLFQSGFCDKRSDIYSLGATLWMLVTGDMPPRTFPNISETTSSTIPSICQRDARLSQGLDNAIQKATRHDMRKRYKTVKRMQRDLEHSQILSFGHNYNQEYDYRPVRMWFTATFFVSTSLLVTLCIVKVIREYRLDGFDKVVTNAWATAKNSGCLAIVCGILAIGIAVRLAWTLYDKARRGYPASSRSQVKLGNDYWQNEPSPFDPEILSSNTFIDAQAFESHTIVPSPDETEARRNTMFVVKKSILHVQTSYIIEPMEASFFSPTIGNIGEANKTPLYNTAAKMGTIVSSYMEQTL